MANYSAKYRLSYTDYFGDTWRFDIRKKEYSGSITTLTGKGNPSTHTVNAAEIDKFTPIRGTTFELAVYNMTFGQYSADFINADRFELQLIVYKNSSEWWRGFFEPANYSEPWQYGPNPVTLMFSCGLGYLKNIKYYDVASQYYGKISMIKLISLCLNSSGSNIPLIDANDLYEDNMATNRSAFEQCYIDAESIGEKETLYETLSNILASFLCNIEQHGGYWYIRNVNALKAAYSYHLYLPGTTYGYQSTGSKDDSITLTSANGTPLQCFMYKSAVVEFLRPYKQLELVQDYGAEKNLLKNPMFNIWKDGDIQAWTASSRNRLAFKGTLKDEFKWYRQTDNALMIDKKLSRKYLYWPISAPIVGANESIFQEIKITATGYEKVKFELNILSAPMEQRIPYTIQYTTGEGARYYMNEDGEWVTSNVAGMLHFLIRRPDDLPLLGTKLTKNSITSKALPFDADDNNDGVLKLTIRAPYFNESFIVGSLTGEVFYQDAALYLEAYDDDGIGLATEREETTTILDNGFENYNYEYKYGDLPNYINSAVLYKNGTFYKSGDDYLLTSQWDGMGLFEKIRQIISSEFNRMQWKLSGTIKGKFNPVARVIGPDRIFMIAESSYNCKSSEYNVTLLQVDATENYLLLEDGEIMETEDGNLIKIE